MDKEVVHSGMPTKIEKAKIAFQKIKFGLIKKYQNPEKEGDMDYNSEYVHYAVWDVDNIKIFIEIDKQLEINLSYENTSLFKDFLKQRQEKGEGDL